MATLSNGKTLPFTARIKEFTPMVLFMTLSVFGSRVAEDVLT